VVLLALPATQRLNAASLRLIYSIHYPADRGVAMGKKHNSKFPAVSLLSNLGEDKEDHPGKPGHRQALQYHPANNWKVPWNLLGWYRGASQPDRQRLRAIQDHPLSTVHLQVTQKKVSRGFAIRIHEGRPQGHRWSWKRQGKATAQEVFVMLAQPKTRRRWLWLRTEQGYDCPVHWVAKEGS